MAAALLADGKADAVEMTRALIADPDLPHKWREGRAADIRPCLLANQDNIIGLVQNPRLSCANNPAAGYEHEAEFAPETRPDTASGSGRGRRTGRSGSGAGGGAARHDVTLYERESRLGGAIRLAAAAPGRERLALAVDWLERQVRALEVTILTEMDMTAEQIGQNLPMP